MYRYAERLGKVSVGDYSVDPVEVLQQQCKAILAAINALTLVEPRFQYLIVKQQRDDSSYFFDDAVRVKTCQVKLSDLQKSYQVYLARLKLGQKLPEMEFVSQPVDLMILYAKLGSFDSAFDLGVLHKLDLTEVFEILAGKCIDLWSGLQRDRYGIVTDYLGYRLINGLRNRY